LDKTTRRLPTTSILVDSFTREFCKMPAGSADPRFAGVATDPRFRRPKQKAVKVEIDARFKEVLESNEFGGPGSASGKKGKRLGKANSTVVNVSAFDTHLN
jgi:hypothetical protein